MACIDSLSKLAANKLGSLGVNKDQLASADKKAVEAAKCNSILDFPAASLLLANATSFLTSTATGLANAETNKLIDTAIGTELAVMGSVTTLLSIITTLGTEVQLFLNAIVINSLKQELRIRILYYELLLFHMQSLLTVLQVYETSKQRPNLLRLKIAYPYIQNAQKIFSNIQKAQATIYSYPVREQQYSLDYAFKDIDIAKRILSGNDSVGLQVASDLKKSSWNDWTKLKTNLTTAFNQQVLYETIYMFENITWNLSRLVLLIPLPFSGLDYTAGSLISNTTLTGVKQVKFDPTAEDVILDNLKKANGLGTTITAIDFAKGLAITNILATNLMEQVMTFEDDFKDLYASANLLLSTLSPVLTLVTSIRDDMKNSQNSSEIELAGKETLWISELISLENMFQKVLGNAFQNEMTQLGAIESLDYLKNVITIYLKKPMDDALLKAITTILATVVQAPVSNKALTESRVLCTMVAKMTIESLKANRRVLSAAENVIMPNLPQMAAFQDLMTAMALMPAPISNLAQGLATGQIATVSSALTGAVSKAITQVDSTINKTANNATSAISSLFSTCPVDKPGTPVPYEIDVVNKIPARST